MLNNWIASIVLVSAAASFLLADSATESVSNSTIPHTNQTEIILVDAGNESNSSNGTESTAIIVSETELGERLFVNYSRNRRPRKRAQDVVEVTIGIFLYNINDIVEKSHEMVITCALSVRWKDEFLVWNDTEPFNQIKSLTVQREEVWIPDVALVNSGDMYALMMADGILANVQSDGSVEFLPMSTITSFCDLDLTYFPFDYQTCLLIFESWTYEPTQETFKLAEKPVNLDKLKINEQWEVLQVTADLDTTCLGNQSCYPGTEFRLVFKRKAAYYNVNIIIPSLIIAIVEIVTFSLPTPEVMKVHISFTCLLAYAVFQTTINADMPRTSEHTPLMSIYIDLQMAFIGIALLGEGVVFICLGEAEHMRKAPKGLRQICDIIARIILVDEANADLEESAIERQENENGGEKQATSAGDSVTNHLYYSPMAITHTSPALVSPFDEQLYSNDNHRPQRRRSINGPDVEVGKYFQVFEEKEESLEKAAGNLKHKHRLDWLFIADVAERLTLIIYVLCISIAPLVIFYILPTINSSPVLHP